MRALFRSHQDYADFAADLHQLVDELVEQHRLTSRLEAGQDRARGYPTRSLGVRTSPATVLDDDGVPMPALSDPTGEAAIRDAGLRSALTARRHELEEATIKARRIITAAADRARTITRPPAAGPSLTDDLWCEHHARHGMVEPRGSEKEVGKHSRLCGWCHAFNREHAQLPPKTLLECKASGRITSKVLAEHGFRVPAPS